MINFSPLLERNHFKQTEIVFIFSIDLLFGVQCYYLINGVQKRKDPKKGCIVEPIVVFLISIPLIQKDIYIERLRLLRKLMCFEFAFSSGWHRSVTRKSWFQLFISDCLLLLSGHWEERNTFTRIFFSLILTQMSKIRRLTMV